MSRTIPSSQYETNLWSTHVNIVRLAEPIRRCVRWRTQVFKIEGFVCKRFLLSPSPPPTFIFWLLFHFSRGQNRGSRSSVFLCSETKRKRLLRRLRTIMYPDKIERRNEGRLARVHRPFGQTDYFVANERFSPLWANTWQSYTKNKLKLVRDLSDKDLENLNPGRYWSLNSTPWIPDSGFQVPDSTNLCQLTLDSGFQSSVGFRIPWAVFQIQQPRIADSTSKNFADSGIQTVRYMGRLEGRRPLNWLTVNFLSTIL